MYIHLSIRLRKGKYVCIYQKSNLVSFRSWTLSSSGKLPEVRVISTLYTTVMMGVRVEWFVSIITSSKYNGEKKGEWTRRFVPPNERRKLEREICSARWIWHLFISRRCYAVYDLRRQAPATTTTRIPDATPALPAPSGVVASARLWKSSEQQVERLYMILSFRPSAGSWLGVLAYRRPCNHASQCGFIGAASCSSVTADLCGPGS